MGKCFLKAGFSSATNDTLLDSISRRIPEVEEVAFFNRKAILGGNELDKVCGIEHAGGNMSQSGCVDPRKMVMDKL